jgi:hypothetical protein
MYKKFFLGILAIILLAISCTQAGLPAATDGIEAVEAGDQAKANFTLRMPTVAPFIVRDKGEKGSKALGSRLFMGATKVKFTIYDYWSGYWWAYFNMRGTWSASSTIAPSSEAMSTIYINIAMPTGTFAPVFEVFNENVSSGTPVAAYYSRGETITVSLPGPNNFTFVLNPTNIAALPCNPAAVGTYPEYPPPLTEAPLHLKQHGEAWFSFTSRSEVSYITCRSYTGDADIYIFDASTYSLVTYSTLATSTEQTILDRDTDDVPDNENTAKDYIIGVWAYGEETFEEGVDFTLEITEQVANGSATGG